MGIFSGTETDWHEVAFDYPSELSLSENCVKGNCCIINQGLSEEELQL